MADNAAGHIMLQEIHEQPAALARLCDAELARVWAMAEKWSLNPPPFIFIAARGTSDHAALYAKYLFETVNGIPVGLAAPSVSSIYQAKIRWNGGLVIGISQSGEAADVISVIERAREGGAATLAITNVGDSPLAAAAEDTILLHANPERAVAATKTFTTTMAALLMLSAAIARNADLRHGLLRLPNLISDVLHLAPEIHGKVERFRYLEECVLLGRGFNMATAYELALKLRETCYIRAQPFASPDFVHGPIAILEEGYPVFAIAMRGAALPSIVTVMRQAQSRGAEVVVFGNAPQAVEAADISFPVLPDHDVPEELSPFTAIVAGQLFAQRLAVVKGVDPDQPRGLKKVTITR